MAYDAARERVVFFGGNSGQTIHNDTWEWDGARWLQRAQYGPPDRTGPAMVYDSARGVCVLFGGWNSEDFHGDTWAWDGVAWTQVSNVGPSPRAWCAMAYDSTRSRVILHGGANADGLFGDTWEWDGSEWTHVSDSGPSPRSSHAMAFDAIRSVCVLVGGIGPSNSYPADTWEWDGGSWLLRRFGMMDRAGIALAFDERRGYVLLFGGTRGLNRFGDTWLWDGESWTREAVEGPEPRTHADMAYDRARSEIVLYGGLGRTPDKPFWDTWLHECGTRPRLAVSASCPDGGPVNVTWRSATPNRIVALVHGREFDRFVVPPPRSCPGTILGLSEGVRTLVRRASDGKGGGSIMGTTAPSDCGTYLQLVDLSTCYTSNVVRIE